MGQYTGQAFFDAIIAIAGNFFIIILVWRSIGHWARDEYGRLIGLVGVAIVIFAFIYFPAQTRAFFSAIVTTVFG